MYDRYDIPIMVVESGLGAVDKIDSDGKIHDDYRIDYLKQHIEADHIPQDIIWVNFMSNLHGTSWNNKLIV